MDQVVVDVTNMVAMQQVDVMCFNDVTNSPNPIPFEDHDEPSIGPSYDLCFHRWSYIGDTPRTMVVALCGFAWYPTTNAQ